MHIHIRVAEADVQLQGQSPFTAQLSSGPQAMADYHRINEPWAPASGGGQPLPGRLHYIRLGGCRLLDAKGRTVGDHALESDRVGRA